MYELCAPAMLYAIFAGLSILAALFSKFQFVSILIKFLFAVAWTWFLNYLCLKGYKVISWFLVLLPLLLMIGIVALVFETARATSNKEGYRALIRDAPYDTDAVKDATTDRRYQNLKGKYPAVNTQQKFRWLSKDLV